MKKYKIKKKLNYYILYKYVILDKSVGFYIVFKGTYNELQKYLKDNNIKVGVLYEK